MMLDLNMDDDLRKLVNYNSDQNEKTKEAC